VGPLHPVLSPCPDYPDGPAGELAYLTAQNAVADAVVGPTANLGTNLRQTWTVWLDGDEVPDGVTATLWSSPDGRLWAPTAQYQKTRPGPGGDVFDLPIASYFYLVVDRSWPGNQNRPAVSSAIQSAR